MFSFRRERIITYSGKKKKIKIDIKEIPGQLEMCKDIVSV